MARAGKARGVKVICLTQTGITRTRNSAPQCADKRGKWPVKCNNSLNLVPNSAIISSSAINSPSHGWFSLDRMFLIEEHLLEVFATQFAGSDLASGRIEGPQ